MWHDFPTGKSKMRFCEGKIYQRRKKGKIKNHKTTEKDFITGSWLWIQRHDVGESK